MRNRRQQKKTEFNISQEQSSSEIIPEQNIALPEEIYDYPKELQKAENLEKYLREMLSSEDHGGILLQKLDRVILNVWVLNDEKLNSVLANYSGEYSPITKLEAKCSWSLLKKFVDELKNISLNEGERLVPIASEYFNMVTVNISKNGEERLKKEVNLIADKLQMPIDSFNFYIYPDTNPLT